MKRKKFVRVPRVRGHAQLVTISDDITKTDLLFYDRVLTADERQRVEKYLRSKRVPS